MSPRRLRPIAATLALLLALPPFPVIAVDLPEMGDSAGTVLTAEQAQTIGSEAMAQLRRAGKLEEDPGIRRYLTGLGNRLAAASDQPRQLTFFVVNDPTVNAFALPGGYVGVHTGLILATHSESELAAVLAHEIAHVTQHHIERGLEAAGKMNLPLTAALIAAVLLGSKNPELGQAAIASSVAGAYQSQLNFTRENEQEADRVGMQMLTGTGFDARSMPSFFERLKEESRFYSGLPEFLSTHPVTDSRIADTRARAEQLPRHNQGDDPTGYLTTKARLRVTAARDPRELLKQLDVELRTATGGERDGLRFARALALERTADYGQASETLKQLLSTPPPRVAWLEALGRVQLAAGETQAALATYAQGVSLYPNNPELSLAYVDALLRTGATEQARTVLRGLNADEWPQVHQLTARVADQAGQPGESHFHLAEYYAALGDITSAITQLKIARRTATNDFYLASRIDARLSDMQEAERARHEREKE